MSNDETSDAERFRAAEVARVQALLDEGWASGIIDEEPEVVLARIIAEIGAKEG